MYVKSSYHISAMHKARASTRAIPPVEEHDNQVSIEADVAACSGAVGEFGKASMS